MSLHGFISAVDARMLLVTVGGAAAALVAIVAAFRLPVVSRPLLWLWRTLVANPVTTWLRGELTAIITLLLAPLDARVARIEGQVQRIEGQVFPNGGRSLYDRADAAADAGGRPKPPIKVGPAPEDSE